VQVQDRSSNVPQGTPNAATQAEGEPQRALRSRCSNLRPAISIERHVRLIRGKKVMLSSVLNSPRAIQMSIMVVEAFVRMRCTLTAVVPCLKVTKAGKSSTRP
jgi:hypothetical protein